MSSRTSGVAVAVNAASRGGRSSWIDLTEPAVIGPEIVAPLRDAVRLVDRDERDVRRDRAQRLDEARATKPLRRDVHEREHAGADAVEDIALLLGRRRPRSARTPRCPRARSTSTWSFISAMSGDTTSVTPPRSPSTTAGSWKHSDLPAPVGITADHRLAGEDIGDHVGLTGPQRLVPEPRERAQQHRGLLGSGGLARGTGSDQHPRTIPDPSDIPCREDPSGFRPRRLRHHSQCATSSWGVMYSVIGCVPLAGVWRSMWRPSGWTRPSQLSIWNST